MKNCNKYLIVGLGNPGIQYVNNRHNIGFQVIDAFCKNNNISLTKNKFNGIYEQVTIGESQYYIGKPFTYMNLSGNFVKQIIDFYKIPTENILVIYDDIDTPVGKYKVKSKGTSGGQNGIKNIIEILKTTEIKRIKIGIGRPQNKNISDYVLADFSAKEKELINNNFNNIFSIINDFGNKTFDFIMNKYNLN